MLRCYLVDDEAATMDYHTALVEQIEGLELIGKNLNPLTALEEIAVLQPGIIFTDYTMPDIGGDTLAEKSRELCPGVKVIVISGNSRHLIDPDGTIFDGYVAKVTTKKKIIAALEVVFPGVVFL
jgi:two-component SAPR family response regulator